MKADSKALLKDHERLLNNLRLLQKNFSVPELAQIIGVSRSTWFSYMKEPWNRFSYDDLKRLARYCGVDFVVLVTDELKVR